MGKQIKRSDALLYHSQPTPGKIKVVPTKKYATQLRLYAKATQKALNVDVEHKFIYSLYLKELVNV